LEKNIAEMNDDSWTAKTIPTKSLTLDEVPAEDAEWDQISNFALTFDVYEVSNYSVPEIGLENAQASCSISELRGLIYHEQRRVHHWGRGVDADTLKKFREVISLIREKLQEQSGGSSPQIATHESLCARCYANRVASGRRFQASATLPYPHDRLCVANSLIQLRGGSIERCSLAIAVRAPWTITPLRAARNSTVDEADDLLDGQTAIRRSLQLPGIHLLCNGTRQGVMPSGMLRSMGDRRKAYVR
jgi:hypothetical protein